MPQPTQAARRFYHAFYRWNLFLTTTTTSTSTSPHHVHHRIPTFTSSVPSRRSQTTIRRVQSLESPTFPSNRDDASKRPTSPSRATNNAGPPREWLTAPPITSAKRPFDTLEVWEDIVRYRSSAGMMVQTAVPVERVSQLEEIYGRGLGEMSEKLFGKGGARVEVGSSRVEKKMMAEQGGNGNVVSVRSVLYSGTFEEVGKVREMLGRRRGIIGKMSGLVKPTTAETEGVVVRGYVSGGEKPYPYPYPAEKQLDLQRNEEEQAPPSTTNQLPSKLSKEEEEQPPTTLYPQHPPKGTNQRIPSTPIKSRSQHPPSNLRPFHYVLRARSDDHASITVETVIPTACWEKGIWDQVLAKATHSKFEQGAKVDVGEPFSLNGRISGRIRARAVQIEGKEHQVRRMKELTFRMQRLLREGKEGSAGGVAVEAALAPPNTPYPSPAPPPPPSSDAYTPLPSFLLQAPKSRAELPTSKLRPLDRVLRARSEDNRTFHLEIVIPANEHWDQEVMALMQQQQQQQQSGLTLELDAPFSRTTGSGERSWRRAVLIKGGVEEVRRMVYLIEGVRDKVLEKMGGKVEGGTGVVVEGFGGVGGRRRRNEEVEKEEEGIGVEAEYSAWDSVSRDEKKVRDTSTSDLAIGGEADVPSIPISRRLSGTILPVYARIAVPTSATGFVIWKMSPLIKESGWGFEIYSEPDQQGRPDVEPTESVLTIRAKDESSLREVVGNVGKLARRILLRNRVDVPEGARSWIGRVVERGTRDAGGADVPDVPTDETAQLTDRSQYPFYSRLAIPATRVGFVIARLRQIEEDCGEGCKIVFNPVGQPREGESGERILTAWAKDKGRLALVKRKLARYVRRASRRDGVKVEAGGEDIRVVEEGGEKKKGDLSASMEKKKIHRPVYSRLGVPSECTGYVLKRNTRILERTECWLVPADDAAEGDGQSSERHVIIWGQTQQDVERAKAVVRAFVNQAMTKDGTGLSVDAAVRVIEEGVEESGMQGDELSQEREWEHSKADMKVYCTFTIPDEVQRYITVRAGKLRAKTGCFLRFAKEYNGVNGDGEKRKGFTAWGRTEKDVKSGLDMVGKFMTELMKKRGMEGDSLSVVEEGVSDTPLWKDIAESGSVEEGMSIEEDANAAVVDAIETFVDNGRSELPEASTAAHGEEDISAVVPSPAESEDGVLYPESSSTPLKEEDGLEVVQNSAEPQDDLIFPEFNPIFADNLPASTTNKTESFSESVPAVSANVGNFERSVQQRAYSTAPTPERAEPAATTATESSEETANAAEENEDVESSSTSEQLAEDLKRTLRTLTHPVVLVTSRLPQIPDFSTPKSKLDIARGVTISSFNAVTLSPKPIISFNLRVPSRSWDAIVSSERLSVHVLAATPQGAAIAHPFTQPYEQPSEPFRRLQRLGVEIFVDAGGGEKLRRSPRLNWVGAVLGRIDARLLQDKCVHVGDHVVVVAEVGSVNLRSTTKGGTEKFVDGGVGLAYAMRGYRGVGEGLEPVELPDLEEAEKGQSGAPSNVAMNEAERKESRPPHNPETNSFHRAENDVDAVDGVKTKTLTAENMSFDHNQEYDREFDDLLSHGEEESGAKLSAGETERRASFDDYFEQFEAEEDPMAGTPASGADLSQNYASTPEIRHNGPKRGSQHPWGITPRLKSSYSTLTNGRKHQSGTTRSYTTSSATPHRDGEDQSNNISAHSQVSDMEVLSSTVADFLDILEDDFVPPPPRIRGLMRAQKEAYHASRRLERAIADGSLTAEESARLENVVTRNERRIAKTLALRSAKDLRRMLDKGRVDFRRAQWLESSIEKGQAVLLEEARQLRRMLDEKSINTDQFRTVKEMLEQQNQILSAEATRLGQMVEEEGEGGEQEGVKAGFDGFQGNI